MTYELTSVFTWNPPPSPFSRGIDGRSDDMIGLIADCNALTDRFVDFVVDCASRFDTRLCVLSACVCTRDRKLSSSSNRPPSAKICMYILRFMFVSQISKTSMSNHRHFVQLTLPLALSRQLVSGYLPPRTRIVSFSLLLSTHWTQECALWISLTIARQRASISQQSILTSFIDEYVVNICYVILVLLRKRSLSSGTANRSHTRFP